jgi:aryl-alcohol dehydrogenase-like predicted oxidoreductase
MAISQMEDSFRRLNCDVIDLYYMHSLQSLEDVDDRLAGGVLEVLLEAQQKGRVRYLGFSGHKQTAHHKRLIERVAGKDPFVAVQHPVSPIDAAKPDSFTNELIPVLLKRDYAVMGMKGFAHGRFFAGNRDNWDTNDPIVPNYLSLEEVIWFNLSQPITSMVCGTDKLEQVTQNISAVRKFPKLSKNDQQELVARLQGFTMTEGLENYRPKPGTY